MKVLAIDPGSAHTGVVCLDDHKVIYAECLNFNDTIKDDQQKLISRAISIQIAIRQIISYLEPDEFVVEGFVNFGVRSNVYTAQTPFVVGAICTGIYEQTLKVPHLQLSRDVLRKPNGASKREFPPMVKEALENVEHAREECTNEHLRSALAHGYYYLKGYKNGQ